MDEKDKMPAILAGAGSAALFWWKSSEQDFHERLRELRVDKRDLQVRLNHLLASGDWLRLQYPSVRDALVGLSAASPALQAPSVAPQPWSVASRPDLTSADTISALRWPPPAGQYDATGRATTPGQLAQTFYALTYEEPRVVLQALTQREPPSSAEKLQLFYAFQALSRAITGQSLSPADWEAVWARLFSQREARPTPGPVIRSFTATTTDTSPTRVGVFPTGKDGIYKVQALCGIQRDDGAGGCLTVFATYSKFQAALSLVGSARLNAQLSSALVGVDTSFGTNGEQIELNVIGKAGMSLSWDNHLTIFTPT